MHSRLHIEIMTRLRSRWSTCRPLLAHRAESAHQRPRSQLPPGHVGLGAHFARRRHPRLDALDHVSVRRLFFFKALARKLQCPAVLRDRAHNVIRGSRRHLGFDLESHRDLRSDQA